MPERKGRGGDNSAATTERDDSAVTNDHPTGPQTGGSRGRGAKRPRRAVSPEKSQAHSGEK